MYLGVDWGKKRIGLALGSDEVMVATPFGVVANLVELEKIIHEEAIEALVVGVPYAKEGRQFELSSEFNNFLKILKQKINLPIFEIDERMSSKAGDARVGNKKTKAPRDAIAAMEILQSWFDAKSNK